MAGKELGMEAVVRPAYAYGGRVGGLTGTGTGLLVAWLVGWRGRGGWRGGGGGGGGGGEGPGDIALTLLFGVDVGVVEEDANVEADRNHLLDHRPGAWGAAAVKQHLKRLPQNQSVHTRRDQPSANPLLPPTHTHGCARMRTDPRGNEDRGGGGGLMSLGGRMREWGRVGGGMGMS